MTARHVSHELRTFRVLDPRSEGVSVRVVALSLDDLVAEFETAVHPDPWQVFGTVRIVDGRVVITALGIRPTPWHQRPEGGVEEQDDATLVGLNGVTSNLLRSIQLGPLLAGIRFALQRHPDFLNYMSELGPVEVMPSPEEGYFEQAERISAAIGEPPRRGRAGYGDDFYRGIALLYLDLQSSGWTRGILAELAVRAQAAGYVEDLRPRDTVATWVRKARQRGFLGAGTPGRAGAEPGPNLHG